MRTKHEIYNEMLGQLSADELRLIADVATDRAMELEKVQPTYDEAIEAGVRNLSNLAHLNLLGGEGLRFEGTAIVEKNGLSWLAVGRKPTSTSPNGWIEFIPAENIPFPYCEGRR